MSTSIAAGVDDFHVFIAFYFYDPYTRYKFSNYSLHLYITHFLYLIMID